MKKVYYIILGIALLLLSCGDSKGGKINQPYDGGHGIGIDTATVKQIQQYEDSIKTQETIAESPKPKSSSSRHHDNMRGFDPASEDDMDDNGMSRYMENNDDEGWD